MSASFVTRFAATFVALGLAIAAPPAMAIEEAPYRSVETQAGGRRMIPGIDPKIDLAFKMVFGSERFGDLTAALINAVREPPPEHRVVEVEFLNPYSDKMTLDDKLSILDVKARDQSEWIYDLEMQMLILAALSPRALYYWAKSYAEQLSAGEDYTRLRRTISICFVNGVVFRDWAVCHRCIRLLDPSGELCLTEDLGIHLIELPKFRKPLAGHSATP